MSQGLGLAQRELLAALYSAPFQQLLRWDLHASEPTASPRRRPANRPDGTEFYLITQLGLAELRHPKLMNSARRPVSEYEIAVSWYSLNAISTTAAERDRLRSLRALYRRAARGLADRGLIEVVQARIHLDDLGQICDIDPWERGYAGKRKSVLARITDSGQRYVALRRTELVSGIAAPVSDDLRRALRSNGFLDIEEPAPRAQVQIPRRPRRGPAGRYSSTEETPRATPVPPPAELRFDEVVRKFVDHGFLVRHVRSSIRAWHQEERRISRELYQDDGIPLHERLFTPEDIAEL
ncbi:hypothetical protein, partial [Nocardia carnea]|uniref:hypothetical protein n=1 Tax=Nocardia carnea TaxID=37328 RepID=UPI002456EB17